MRERNFAYAVGRIRSLENKLLDNSQLERLINTTTVEELFTQLGETEYATALGNIANPQQFESALNAELERIIRLVLELGENAPELRWLTNRYDIQNLKLILKSEDVQPEQLSKLGVWQPEWLLAVLQSEDLADLPEQFREAISEARSSYEVTKDIQEIDRILDNAWFQFGYTILKEEFSPLLLQWWTALVDLTNLRSFIRLRIIGLPYSEFERFFIANGNLKLDDFKGLWEQPNEKVAVWIDNTKYSRILTETPSPLNSLTSLEKAIDNYLLELIMPAKSIPLGIEALAGYLLAKENEVKLLRIIVIGKINQVSNLEIKGRLRRAYA